MESLKVVIAGTDYVGLTTGVALAHLGHRVTCVDVDPHKIGVLNEGKSPIHEEGIEELIALARSRLVSTADAEFTSGDLDIGYPRALFAPAEADDTPVLVKGPRYGTLDPQSSREPCALSASSTAESSLCPAGIRELGVAGFSRVGLW